MKEEIFVKVGFSNNEAKVYLMLVRLARASAHSLIQETKLHKGVVYDNLERLIDKGLITFIIEDGKKIFSIASPEMLSVYIDDEEKELKKRKELINQIKEDIEKTTQKSREKQDATIYKGIKAIKSFYSETLEKGDYYVFGGPKESVDIMGELFWDAYHMKRRKKKINSYMLFNSSLKKWGEEQKGKYTIIKYFDKDFEPKTETHIQDNFVAIIVWSDDPVLFRINNKEVAEAYKIYFDKLWKIAKK